MSTELKGHFRYITRSTSRHIIRVVIRYGINGSFGTTLEVSRGTEDTELEVSPGTELEVSPGTELEVSPGTELEVSSGTALGVSLCPEQEVSPGTEQEVSLGPLNPEVSLDP